MRPSALAGPLADHLTLELGERPDHLQHHPPRRGGGVDSLGQRLEPHLHPLEAIQEGQQVLEAAAEPVELPDHQHVPGAQGVEQAVQLRTLPAATRGVFYEDALGTCGAGS